MFRELKEEYWIWARAHMGVWAATSGFDPFVADQTTPMESLSWVWLI